MLGDIGNVSLRDEVEPTDRANLTIDMIVTDIMKHIHYLIKHRFNAGVRGDGKEIWRIVLGDDVKDCIESIEKGGGVEVLKGKFAEFGLELNNVGYLPQGEGDKLSMVLEIFG